MPIDNGTPINNTGVTDEPMYYNWPSSIVIHKYKSINIPGVIAPETLPIKIKDVIGLYPYVFFRLKYVKSYIPTGINWIKGFTYTDTEIPDSNGIIAITENALSIDFPLEIINSNLLSAGTYTYRQVLTVQGRTTLFSSWKDISTLTHDTVLHMVEDLAFYNPKTLNYSHNIGTTLPTKEVIIEGPSWKLVGNPRFTLSSDDPSVIIQPVSSIDGDFQIANGTGIATVKITLGTYFDLPGLFLNSVDYLKVMSGINLVGNIVAKVKRFTFQTLSLSPAEIIFVAQKNITDAAAQNLFFECNVAYDIEAPIWTTTAVEMISVDGIATQVIVVTPLSSSNMDAGTYIGFIKVTAIINGVETIATTLVTYHVISLAQFPYSKEDLSFTLDNKFVNLVTSNTGTYIQMTTIVKSYDFYTDLESEHTIPEKIGLFKGRAQVNIGKTIHQILRKDKAINENIQQYKPAIVKMFFEEKNLLDNSYIRGTTSDNFSFIAGLGNNFSKFGFLKFNHLPERVTNNSFKYLNIAVTEGAFRLRTYKNGTVFSEVELIPSEGKIMTVKVFFDTFVQGEVVEYSILNTEDEESSKISFILFPEGMYSNALIWEDEFLLKQVLECTGTYNIKSNLSFTSQKVYKNLVEQLSHLDVSKVSKITINTGWIMQSDVDTIESIMKSKKAWITHNDKTIFLAPITDSLVNSDSERELVDYTLEFQINPTYNEETYKL